MGRGCRTFSMVRKLLESGRENPGRGNAVLPVRSARFLTLPRGNKGLKNRIAFPVDTN
jgi:hypothetical protein